MLKSPNETSIFLVSFDCKYLKKVLNIFSFWIGLTLLLSKTLKIMGSCTVPLKSSDFIILYLWGAFNKIFNNFQVFQKEESFYNQLILSINNLLSNLLSPSILILEGLGRGINGSLISSNAEYF